VSEVGKVLDPIADRLAIAAGLIAFTIAGLFPVWAAALILVRDPAVVVAGAYALSRYHVRLDVRWIGKVATFTLMIAIPALAWASLDLPLHAAAVVIGWTAFAAGIVEYYLAGWVYAEDLRIAVAAAHGG
jgi:cardiolipin synthase